uniref:Uncharacterized protein n=1 Tax=Lactuca sativa TaxID=4236 RepID=A0A9R1UWE3_LACSA|nr:hypothetical protein LSAT_V11C700353740 [Lactuca sativa]
MLLVHVPERAARPAPDANLDTFLSSASLSAQERREKQIRVQQLKGKMLVMKNSNQNVPERDIHTLSNFQIIVENELFEATAKAFTGMVDTIIDKKLWAGAFDQADVHLVENPKENRKQ